MHTFQQQDTGQTLAEGLEEYFAANPDLARGRALSPEAQEFFRCHDVVHVVYGCNVTLDDELVVKMASLIGTTAGLGVLKGYRLHASRQIYRRLRGSDVLRTILHAVIIVPRTVLRCLSQRARWPWDSHQPWLERPLRELRREFGIRVAHPLSPPRDD